jgi:hypothetical protein
MCLKSTKSGGGVKGIFLEAHLRPHAGTLHTDGVTSDEKPIEPVVKPIQNGWHALSREMNLAVWGKTEDEARANFALAAAKAEELRARPAPKVG